MTYNIHGCRGTDGRLSPERIARVIAQYRPDIIALQEVDVGRARSKGVDQAQHIAHLLAMRFHFHPALRLEEESYGDAVLSALPMRLVRAGPLPRYAHREPRGALWVAIELAPGVELQLINTHLGLSLRERTAQVDALLGADWLGHQRWRAPGLLCGDLNALPNSAVCRRLGRRLDDAQRLNKTGRVKRTFHARLPLACIDYVFVSAAISVVNVEAPKTKLTRAASDHLPLLVDVEIA